jgi:hypothetical protein
MWKYILMGGLIVISPIIVLLNALFGGILSFIKDCGLFVLGWINNGFNAYLSFGMFIGLSLLFIGFNYLLMRKIETK